jgi:hypothetical protein
LASRTLRSFPLSIPASRFGLEPSTNWRSPLHAALSSPSKTSRILEAAWRPLEAFDERGQYPIRVRTRSSTNQEATWSVRSCPQLTQAILSRSPVIRAAGCFDSFREYLMGLAQFNPSPSQRISEACSPWSRSKQHRIQQHSSIHRGQLLE